MKDDDFEELKDVQSFVPIEVDMEDQTTYGGRRLNDIINAVMLEMGAPVEDLMKDRVTTLLSHIAGYMVWSHSDLGLKNSWYRIAMAAHILLRATLEGKCGFPLKNVAEVMPSIFNMLVDQIASKLAENNDLNGLLREKEEIIDQLCADIVALENERLELFRQADDFNGQVMDLQEELEQFKSYFGIDEDRTLGNRFEE